MKEYIEIVEAQANWDPVIMDDETPPYKRLEQVVKHWAALSQFEYQAEEHKRLLEDYAL